MKEKKERWMREKGTRKGERNGRMKEEINNV